MPIHMHGHFLMVSMHAVNSFLLFIICKKLFTDSGIKNESRIALSGVVLYTVCPHISEVIVWESAFHYLQGFFIVLFILWCTQQFIHTAHKKYAWWAGILYLCSTYSLEIFYLTPWFGATMALYYRFGLGYDRNVFKKVIRWFFIPQLVLFVMHLIVLKVVYSYPLAHIGTNVWQPFTDYICKPPRYLFHIVFMGRFFPHDTRSQVYELIGSNAALLVFYSILILVCLHIAANANRMSTKGKAAVLLFAWIILTQAIIMPLAFPDILLVFFDRYTYFLDAFVYMLVALLVSYITNKYVWGVLLSAYGLTNLYFTVKLNMIWKHSAYITNRLLKELPPPGNRTVVILNLPQNMRGIPMIGAERDGQFKKMYELLIGHMPNKIYDAAAYNMMSRDDGAQVMVVNDSTVKVTLNQWGTWWWYADYGAVSYENEDYSLNMVDMGHYYLLTLKHPNENYLVLFQVGDQWRTVNWGRKNEEQY